MVDIQPIRAACFSPRGEHLALGTNSRSLKICLVPNINDDDEDEEEEIGSHNDHSIASKDE